MYTEEQARVLRSIGVAVPDNLIAQPQLTRDDVLAMIKEHSAIRQSPATGLITKIEQVIEAALTPEQQAKFVKIVQSNPDHIELFFRSKNGQDTLQMALDELADFSSKQPKQAV